MAAAEVRVTGNATADTLTAGRTPGQAPRASANRWPNLNYENLFDLLVMLLLMAAFILGYLQGSIRRLLGIVSVLFSFVLAAQVRGPLGDFLIGNWTQFLPEYSRMLAFGVVFFIISLAFTLLIQNVYERSPVLPRFTYVDPLLGGVLGMVQAGIIIGAGVMILDSYFLGVGTTLRPAELLFLRDFAHAIDVSQAARIYRHDLIPAFFVLLGGLIPEDVRAVFAK